MTKEETTMKIESKRFGSIEVREDRILQLKGGLLGFNHLDKFALLDDREDPTLPFRWMVSIQDPEVGFLVTDPGIFFKDYVFGMAPEDTEALNIRTEADAIVLTLLTVPKDPKQITANLVGPIVVNANTFHGKQIIVEGSAYTTKHYIFIQAKVEEEKAAANIAAAAQSFAIAVESTATGAAGTENQLN
jgi:flagellar assembly factor FliW